MAIISTSVRTTARRSSMPAGLVEGGPGAPPSLDWSRNEVNAGIRGCRRAGSTLRSRRGARRGVPPYRGVFRLSLHFRCRCISTKVHEEVQAVPSSETRDFMRLFP